MRMSFPRAREVGKVPPFCFQARFPRHGGAEDLLRRVKLSKHNVPKMRRVTGVVVVYYCRTYEKAVSGGGERENMC